MLLMISTKDAEDLKAENLLALVTLRFTNTEANLITLFRKK